MQLAQRNGIQNIGVNSRRLVVGLMVAVLLSIWTTVGLWSWWEHSRTVASGTLVLEQLSSAVQEQTRAIFQQSQTSLTVATTWIAANPGKDPGTAPDFIDLSRKVREASNNQIEMRLVTRQGNVRLIPDLGKTAHINVADRDYFLAQLNANTRGFYISKPLVSRLTGKWAIPVSIPVDNAGGDVIMLTAVIELETIATSFEAQRIKPAGTIAIVHANNLMLFRSPIDEVFLGKPLFPNPTWERILGGPQKGDLKIGSSPIDGLARTVAYAKIPGYPLYAFVTTATDDMLAPWRLHLQLLVVIAAAISLFGVLFTRLLLKSLSSEYASRARLENLINFDPLTDLPNRTLLNDRVTHGIMVAARDNSRFAVMFLDLDHFKNINDTLGHSIGDELLVQVGMRLKESVREVDTVSRIGGDEFVVVMTHTAEDAVARIATKLLATIARPYSIASHSLIITPSIGIAMYPEDGIDFETLYRHADTAMYRSKHDGRNGFCFFTKEMQSRTARMLILENAMHLALDGNQFHLHYQPQLTKDGRQVIGVEALLRWSHPELGAISPAEFIPLAESNGQIIPMGSWVLETAVRQLKGWLQAGLPPMVMAVNLSAVQFRHANLFSLVAKILQEHQLPPEYLELELTESVAMGNTMNAVAVMEGLHAQGIRLSIDDFGTGYSSLSHLKKFNVHKLKIDQSFVRDIATDADDRSIVTAIIQMAHSLGFKTIAEGVETQAQWDFLNLHHCDEVQGYFFCKPLPADQLQAFVQQKMAALP